MIEFINLQKTFTKHTVLRGINLKISDGETVAIVGKSGEGKSVLLKHIVGLEKPSSGSVIINNQDISDLPEKDLFPIRRICGYIFQLPALFDFLTVVENVAFGLRNTDISKEKQLEKAKETLKLVNIGDIYDKYPYELSFGMQKRVSLARTLATSPQYLLYDEPTTGLDPVNTGMINELIISLANRLKVTSVVVTHDMASACMVADRIVILSEGNVVAIGTPSEIKNSEHPIAKAFMLEVER